MNKKNKGLSALSTIALLIVVLVAICTIILSGIARRRAYLFANVRIERPIVFLPNHYNQSDERVINCGNNDAQIISSDGDCFTILLYDYSLEDVLSLESESDSGAFYSFKSLPNHFLLYKTLHQEQIDSTLSWTDNLPNALNCVYSLEIKPFWGGRHIKRISSHIPLDVWMKIPYNTAERFYSVIDYFTSRIVEEFAKRWFKKQSISPIIAGFSKESFSNFSL